MIKIYLDDCLNFLKNMKDKSVDLIYLDPPFFTQKNQKLLSKNHNVVFSFSDIWNSVNEYGEYLYERLVEMKRVLCDTGSIFFHCDRRANHTIRLLMDNVFGTKMFRSEIIWIYKRWSNSQKNLIPSHQTIYFYSKTDFYKFNTILGQYSNTTNVDQLLQKRIRNVDGKCVYAKNENNEVISSGCKSGVPLSDVWDIPYLNPKAKERVGYPTQKPILLLERIIQLCTDIGDIILDPFCGSGTTIVAAKLLERNAIGIDISEKAVELANKRIENIVKSESKIVDSGRDSYVKRDNSIINYMNNLDIIPIYRNNGIDAILNVSNKNSFIPIRVQKSGESIEDAVLSLNNACIGKNPYIMILISTQLNEKECVGSLMNDKILIVNCKNMEM